jgi:hypothetical protein
LPGNGGRFRSVRRSGALRHRVRRPGNVLCLRLPVLSCRHLAVGPHDGKLLSADLPAPVRSRHRHLFRPLPQPPRQVGDGRDYQHHAVHDRCFSLSRAALSAAAQGAAPLGGGHEPDTRLGGGGPLPPGAGQRHRRRNSRQFAVARPRRQPERQPLAETVRRRETGGWRHAGPDFRIRPSGSGSRASAACCSATMRPCRA